MRRFVPYPAVVRGKPAQRLSKIVLGVEVAMISADVTICHLSRVGYSGASHKTRRRLADGQIKELLSVQAAVSIKCDQPFWHAHIELTPHVSRRIFKSLEQIVKAFEQEVKKM